MNSFKELFESDKYLVATGDNKNIKFIAAKVGKRTFTKKRQDAKVFSKEDAETLIKNDSKLKIVPA